MYGVPLSATTVDENDQRRHAARTRFDHLPARNTQGVGGHRAELDVGQFEKLLNAIGHFALGLL